MKLKSIVTMSKPYPQPVTSKQSKPVEVATEATFSSRQIPEIKEYAEQGKKCRLVLEGEVSSFQSANTWDIQEGRLSKGDVSVTIKFLQGSIEEIGGNGTKPKGITEAGHMIRDEMKKKM